MSKSKTLPPKAFSDFTSLYNHCRGRYPKVIEDNLDVLYRKVWTKDFGIPDGSTFRKVYVRFGRRLLLHTYFIKSLLKPRKPRFDSECDLLVSFRGCRSDQQAFIFPICDRLRSQGVKIAIFTSKREFDMQISPNLFGDIPFIFSEDYYSFGAWVRGCIFYRRLRLHIRALCHDLHLDQESTRGTYGYFQQYVLDKETFGSVLETLRPSLIYGIYYIPNPGYLAAISDRCVTGHRIKNILIQHGPFPAGVLHDFKGADLVILWGEYYQSNLNSIRTIALPASIPLGNPKLEILLSNGENGPRELMENEKRAIDILYVGTPDTPLTGIQNQAALELFAHVVQNYNGKLTVLYKMHPSESLKNYHEMMDLGLIQADQIVRDVSVYRFIKDSRIVVGTVTAVLPEAMAMGKPVIQIRLSNLMTDWHNYGISTASTQEELSRQIDMILDGGSYRQQVFNAQNKLVKAMFGDIAGSANRIADHLLYFL